jgi:hypothetical protein
VGHLVEDLIRCNNARHLAPCECEQLREALSRIRWELLHRSLQGFDVRRVGVEVIDEHDELEVGTQQRESSVRVRVPDGGHDAAVKRRRSVDERVEGQVLLEERSIRALSEGGLA